MIGFVNLFKPAGPSSAHAVARVRRIYALYAGDRRLTAGHLGTLDPQAAGVLPVAVGKATRLIPLLDDQRKELRVHARARPLDDDAGRARRDASRARPVPADWARRLEAALPRFVGKIAQVPPMYSAAAPSRAAALRARARRQDRRAQAARHDDLRLDAAGSRASEPFDRLGHVARLRVACSEGTYVRTLCHDLGAAIGVPAHMGALVREASGPFVLYESRTLDEIATDPEARADRARTHHSVSDDRARSARIGRLSRGPRRAAAGGRDGTHVFVRDESRTLVGVGEALGALLAPRKVFVVMEVTSRARARRRPAARAGDRLLRRLSSRASRDRAADAAPAQARLAFGRADVREPSGRASCGPGTEPPLICTPEERARLCSPAAGFEECFFVKFDDRSRDARRRRRFSRFWSSGSACAASSSARPFASATSAPATSRLMREYLARARRRARAAVDPVTRGRRAHLEHAHPRARSAGGDVAEADRLLGGTGYETARPGRARRGTRTRAGLPDRQRSRAARSCLPKDGVYSAVARYDGRDHPALVSIGNNPQFGGDERTVEAWLRDFQHTIYGRELALRDLRYVREQRLFGESSELVEQMQRDLQTIGFPSYG